MNKNLFVRPFIRVTVKIPLFTTGRETPHLAALPNLLLGGEDEDATPQRLGADLELSINKKGAS